MLFYKNKMMSERVQPISQINGVTIKSSDLRASRVVPCARGNEDLYSDPWEEVRKEKERIRKMIPAPIPADFPKELRPYWKGHLEFSYTPCQSGWIYLAGLKKNNRYNR